MARRQLAERNIRKISKTGNGRTFSITLPIELVRELGWREKQKLVVRKRGQGLLIEDWQEK